MRYLAILLAASTTVNCWQVQYYEGASCTSDELGAATYTDEDLCVNVDLDNVSSATAEPDGTSGTISFFVGSGCTGLLLGTLTEQGCLNFSENGFGSVGLNS